MSHKPYILFADDDILTRDTISALLQKDYEVKCVDNGQDCIDSVNERTPCLVLLDIYMPVIDGFETANLLRVHSKFKNKPIIFLTGLDGESIDSNAYNSGGDACLHKPIDINQLKATIQKLIPR